MLVIVLNALVVRATPTETAVVARDRLWRAASVAVHVHDYLLTSGVARCLTCGAVLGIV